MHQQTALWSNTPSSFAQNSTEELRSFKTLRFAGSPSGIALSLSHRMHFSTMGAPRFQALPLPFKRAQELQLRAANLASHTFTLLLVIPLVGPIAKQLRS